MDGRSMCTLGDDGALGEEAGIDVDAEAGAGGDFDDAVGVTAQC